LPSGLKLAFSMRSESIASRKVDSDHGLDCGDSADDCRGTSAARLARPAAAAASSCRRLAAMLGAEESASR
jgi:hypothetical protein